MANDFIQEVCESPIEIQLAAVLARVGADCPGLLCLSPVSLDRLGSKDFTGTAALVLPQQTMGPWRVDFLVVIRDFDQTPRLDRMVVVECDGHDWHERTPEQASRDKARDRYFAEAGTPVMRFTGREIWRDAAGCAEQIGDAIKNIVTDSQIEAVRLAGLSDGGKSNE